MHYLLTGGTGLIGTEICHSLLASGQQVSVYTRDPDKATRQCGSTVTAYTDLTAIPETTQIDVVINLAGAPIADWRWTASRKCQLEASRVDLTLQLVNWLCDRQQRPQALISGSAVGWYGDQGDNLLTENSDFHDEYSHRLCSAWEAAALQAEHCGIRVAIVRTGLVIAAKGGFLKRLLLPFRLGLGGRISHGQQYMPWVHLQDIAALFIFLSRETTASGVFNGTAPQPVTNQQFTAALAKALHRPALLPVPAPLLKLLLGEMSQLLLGGQRAVPEKAQALGFQFLYTDIDSALNSVI